MTKSLAFKCNTDLSENYFDQFTARFIKNLTANVSANAISGTAKAGQNTAVQKPLQSNEIYCTLDNVPEGENVVIHAKGFPQVNRVYCFVFNSLGNHFIYRINGDSRTCEKVFQDKDGTCLSFILDPKYFIHESGSWLEVFTLVDPETGQVLVKEELYWTDGLNYQGYLRVQDSIDTNSFDPVLFPYFQGNYNKCWLTRMGLSTPKDCIGVAEIQRTDADAGANNRLLFNTWQFRLRYTDVWGRVSEHGIISDEYVPGINDCLAVSDKLARCLNLTFDAGNPTINTIEVEWRNCNDESWKREETLFLWKGSNIGKWWLRQRNTDIIYNPETNKITYRFCRDKECDPVDTNETNKLQPGQPKISQVLTKFNNEIGLLNNKDGFNPFPQELLKKFSLQVTPPQQIDIQTRNITIYIPIWNEALQNFQQVFNDGTNGYAWGDNNSKHGGARAYSQYFTNIQQSGFVGYLVGGGLAISTQVYVDANGQLIDDPTHVGLDTSPRRLTFQKFVFNNVPKGNYVFRLASSLSNPQTEANYQDTSTTVFGKCPFSANGYQIDVTGRQNNQELLIDVCTADYDTMTQNEILVIADLAAFVSGQSTKAISGYVYETHKNGFLENPVELCNVTCQNGQVISNITDHNGFYFYATRGSGRNFNIRFRNKCITQQITNGQSGSTGMQFTNFILENYYADYSITECNRILITGKLLLNGTNIGVSNSVVVLTRGRTALTDDNGMFTIIAHDDVLNGTRVDNIVIGAGGCAYTGLNNTCIQVISVTILPCSVCSLRTIDVGTTDLEYKTERGLLSGETYGVFVSGYDWLGRKTYAQPLGSITIPTIIDSKAIAPSVVTGIIDPSAVFPPEIEYVVFSITEGNTIETYLDWIVDRVEFIDSTGAINTAAPTQIKVYYQSIIEFSAVHNYNTTMAWQFIPQGQNTPAISDKVQFYLNGDGTYLNKLNTSLIKYDTSGVSFLIDYTSDLKDLKANALMRLIRPKTCTGTEPNYEICKVVDIVNHAATENSFVLNFFDTYYLSLQIPVPAPVTPSPTVSQIATVVGSVTTYTVPVPVSTVLELRIFGFRFESRSPSAFWGDNCKNIGRVNSKNPYEAELVHPNQVALSSTPSINGQLNYLQTFDESGKTDFELKDNSGIVAAYVENGQVGLITQFDNARCGFNDNLARMDAQGNIQVPSAANKFGKPERKVGDNYGCQLIDKNSIRYRNGLISFVDRSRAEIVQYNFSSIQSYTRDERLIVDGVKVGKYDAAFRAKVKSMQPFKKRYFVGGIDPITDEYLLTDFDLANKSYINQERTYLPQPNETIVFDLNTRDLKGWRSFTPENYAFLDGNLLNVQLFTFVGAVPYAHYNVNNNTSFNTFYGVKCERVMHIVSNIPQFTKKKWLSIENYCKQSKYFADLIVTEAGQRSALFLDNVQRADFFSFAAFMCDIDTPKDPYLEDEVNSNPLYDGDTLYGMWISVRLIGDPDLNDKYSEFMGTIIEFFNEQKTG